MLMLDLLRNKKGYLFSIYKLGKKKPTYVLKLFGKILLFLKLDDNKIELQVKLDINNVKFYAYVVTYIFLKI